MLNLLNRFTIILIISFFFSIIVLFIFWLKRGFITKSIQRIEEGAVKVEEVEEEVEEGVVKVEDVEEEVEEGVVKVEDVEEEVEVEEEIEVEEVEEKDRREPRKPYIKASPTEEWKPPTEEWKPPTEERRKKKEIDLGEKKRRPRKVAKVPEAKKPDKSPKKGLVTRIASPFVEFDLNEAKVFLVLPPQQLKVDNLSKIPRKLIYEIELNGEKHEVTTAIIRYGDDILKIEECRICLEEPLESLQVDFRGLSDMYPDAFYRAYIYNHKNRNFYAFLPIGNNRGRMHCLFDQFGNIRYLPRKNVWILLKEDFDLGIMPDVIEERWIWEEYKPLLINLRESDELVVKSALVSGQEELSCEMIFSIDGEAIITDDLKEVCPLLTGETLKLKASRENESAWNVWIQNKQVGCQLIDESWTGSEMLELKLPEELHCECGEFQLDICQQDTRIPDETLFFRWIPFIELNYPKELVIPAPNLGHKPEVITVNLGNSQKWELKPKENLKVNLMDDRVYQIELPPKEDTVFFSIAKKSNLENDIGIQITVPRLKWKTSKEEGWNDKLIEIKRKDLERGDDFYLTITTNDFNSKYKMTAILKTDRQLQEKEFNCKGVQFSLLMNEFYDTIDQNKDRISLVIEIENDLWEVTKTIEILTIPSEKWKYDYFKDKKVYSEEDNALLNQIFEITEKVLSLKPIIDLYTYEEIKPHRVFNRYIDDIQKNETFSDEEILKKYDQIDDFISYEKQDFDEWLKNVAKIILLPHIMYCWFYNGLKIPFIPRDEYGLLFYLDLFDNKEIIMWIFERDSYEGKVLDMTTARLIEAAHTYLDLQLPFIRNFENPKYRYDLLRFDLSKTGAIKYLVKKWQYFISRDGSLRNMPIGDEEFLSEKTIEEEIKKVGEYFHGRLSTIDLKDRIDFHILKKRSKEDREKALNDAIKFFRKLIRIYRRIKNADRSS